MAQSFKSRKSFADFSDRDLLLLILSNQVKIFRQTEYLMNEIKGKGAEPLGHYENTIGTLIKDSDSILQQAGHFMKRSDEDKGFLEI